MRRQFVNRFIYPSYTIRAGFFVPALTVTRGVATAATTTRSTVPVLRSVDAMSDQLQMKWRITEINFIFVN